MDLGNIGPPEAIAFVVGSAVVIVLLYITVRGVKGGGKTAKKTAKATLSLAACERCGKDISAMAPERIDLWPGRCPACGHPRAAAR